jgi:hypothetical protein
MIAVTANHTDDTRSGRRERRQYCSLIRVTSGWMMIMVMMRAEETGMERMEVVVGADQRDGDEAKEG